MTEFDTCVTNQNTLMLMGMNFILTDSLRLLLKLKGSQIKIHTSTVQLYTNAEAGLTASYLNTALTVSSSVCLHFIFSVTVTGELEFYPV